MPSLKAAHQGLDRIKQARKRKGWTIEDSRWLIEASQIVDSGTDWASTTYAEQRIFAPGVSLSTWKRFLRGEPINDTVFKAFCQLLELNWQEVKEKDTGGGINQPPIHPFSRSYYSAQDWGVAPDVPVFFGREPELATLKQWIIHDRCRLIAILGMGGMGKTHLSVRLGSGGMGKTDLSVKLARDIQDEFDHVIWRSLLNMPTITEVLTDLIYFLSNQQEIHLPSTLDGCISRLLHYLRTHRCLLILDNVETILCAGSPVGHYRDGYEGYGQLFQQIGDVPHQSCLLLTSREKPKELARLEGRTRPVRSLELHGLDAANGKRIFDEIGDFSGSESEWQILIEQYSGNPLALELTAKHIDEVFGGSLSAFLNEGNFLFHDLHHLLSWHFNRLSDLEKEVVYWLAINREPVSVADLKADILSPFSKEQIPATLQSLQRRLPLERVHDRFTLQPMLIEDITQRMIDQVCEEVQTANLTFFRAYAFLKASAKDYIRDSQQRLILQPLMKRLQSLFTDSWILQRHLAHLISLFQNKSVMFTGYAAGNLLNLLSSLSSDLSDRDFSALFICQAHLSGATLHRTNFAHAVFDRCVFAETISSITAIAFSPDGQFLATGVATGELRLWEVTTGKQLAAWKGHVNWIGCLVFSPDGQVLASGSHDRTIRLWSVESGNCVRILEGHKTWVRTIIFSPDGRFLISSSEDQTIYVWNILTGERSQILQGHTDIVWSIAINFAGDRLVSGSFDHTIKIWNLQTGECLKTLQEHTNRVDLVAFSPDGQTILSVSRDQTIKSWDSVTGECLMTVWTNFGELLAPHFNSQRTVVAIGSNDCMLKLWEVNTGNCLKTLHGHIGVILSLAFDPTGTICATGGDDQTIRLWDVTTGRNFRTFQGYQDGVQALTFIPNCNQLVSGHGDWQVRLWNSSTGECLATFPGHRGRIWDVACHPDGQILASCSSDRTVRLWSPATGDCLQVLQGHQDWVWSVAFSPDGTILASGDDSNVIKLWDIQSGECLNTLSGHQGRVWSLDFSPNGKILASGSQDQTVRLWEVTTSRCLKVLSNSALHKIWSAQFSPDGQTLACSSSDHTLSLWSVKTGNCLRVFEGHSKQVWRVAFTLDGKMIASGSDDQTVRVWDVATGDCLRVLKGHTSAAMAVAFSQDNSILSSSSQDGTIRLWNLMTNTLKILRAPRPCEEMNITGIQGLTAAEKATLKALGAKE